MGIYPHGYWTKEQCADEALKYKKRIEFKQKSSGAYQAAIRLKILNEICGHMIHINNVSGFWTKERCIEEAKKYDTISDFIKNARGAYSSSLRQSINLDELIGSKRKDKDYWTKERCAEEAAKYTSRKMFCEKKRRIYEIAKENNWLDNIIPLNQKFLDQKPEGYWTFDRCQEIAKKYTNKSDFAKQNSMAYKHSRINGWLHEICKHMECQGRKDLRYVYACEFDNNHVYIGLTCDLARRKNEHLTNEKSTPFKYANENNKTFQFIPLITEPINLIYAGELEDKYIKKYKENGWTVINKAKAGGIGGYTRKWTYEICKELASTCKTRGEFARKCEAAANAARQNNWLYELFPEPKKESYPRNYWTKERCAEIAKKYNLRTHLQKDNPSVYTKIKYNRWDDLLEHMEIGYGHLNKKWTFDTCKLEAANYKTRTQFSKENGSAYSISLRNKWLDIFFPK